MDAARNHNVNETVSGVSFVFFFLGAKNNDPAMCGAIKGMIALFGFAKTPTTTEKVCDKRAW